MQFALFSQFTCFSRIKFRCFIGVVVAFCIVLCLSEHFVCTRTVKMSYTLMKFAFDLVCWCFQCKFDKLKWTQQPILLRILSVLIIQFTLECIRLNLVVDIDKERCRCRLIFSVNVYSSHWCACQRSGHESSHI